MLMAILEFRARVCELYQKLQLLIDPIFKFILSFLVIRTLNTVIGYDARLAGGVVTTALALVCAFVPSSILALLCMLLTIAHVFHVNMLLSVFVALILLVLYCFFLRFTPKYGYVIVAVPVLFLFRVPYLMPLLLGLLATPVTILPLSCGIFFYYMISVIQNAAALQFNPAESFDTENIMLLVNNVVDNLLSNKEMIFTIVIYALVLTVVYVVRKLEFDYSFEVAVLIGVVASVFGHVMMNSRFELPLSLMAIVLYHVLAGVLVIVIYFFIRVLDYTAVEHVQFEDDDYYYYVRAVPKIKVGLPQLNIRKVTEKSYFTASLENEEDFFNPDEMERKLMEKRNREAEERAEEKKKQRKEWLMNLFSGKREETKEMDNTLVIQDLMDEPVEDDDGYVTLVNCRIAEDGTITECPERTGHWAWKHPHQADGTVTYTELRGDITMYNVDFGYVPEKTVLHDVTLYANPGQKLAFVGATGAGKTTITNLINRFYDIADGKIRYDDININKIPKLLHSYIEIHICRDIRNYCYRSRYILHVDYSSKPC